MRKFKLFTLLAALCCSMAMWAADMEGPWTRLAYKTGQTGLNETKSSSFNGLNGNHWANIGVWNDDDGIGYTIRDGSSVANTKTGVFSIYERQESVPSYTRKVLTWTFQVGSCCKIHYSNTCLYALYGPSNDLKNITVDFTYNYSNGAGSGYRAGRYTNTTLDDQGHFTNSTTWDMGFDNRNGTSQVTKYWSLLLTHVVGSGESVSGLHEWGSFKSISYSWATYYYKYVSFNANGGSGSMSTQTIENSGTLTANAFSRTGYSFAGWATTSNGSQAYANKGTITATSSSKGPVTLYARWSGNKYTVTLNQQSGSGGSSSVQAIYGSAMPSMTRPSRAGYTFLGYYTSSNGGGTKYYNANGSSAKNWDITSATTLYAYWTLDTYSISYNLNGGSLSSTNPSSYNVTSNTFTLNNPTRTGYTFAGWTGSNGSTPQTSVSVSKGSTGNKTYTANWTANNYTVTFDMQEGTGGSEQVQATYDAAMPEITLPTRAGYTFGGYFASSNGQGTKYYNADGSSANNWNVASATTICAYWIGNEYTVSFDMQEGTGGSEQVQATSGSAMPAITLPTRTGYEFKGYFSAAEGVGTKYYNADGSSATNWNIAQNTTLYAKWALPPVNDFEVVVDIAPTSYTPTQIINGGFESNPNNNPYYKSGAPYEIGQGWMTSENQSDWAGNYFEWLNNSTQIRNWSCGIQSSSSHGVEMNAQNSAVLYQDLRTCGLDVIRWTLNHGARRNYGPTMQSMRVEVGAPQMNGSNIVLATGVNAKVNSKIITSTKAIFTHDGVSGVNGYDGENLEYLLLNKDTQCDQWYTPKGVYIIPEGQTITRFAFIADSQTSNWGLLSGGNFLDDITFSTLIGNLSAVYDDYGRVTVRGYWGEEDTSKKLIIKIGTSSTHELDMKDVLHQNFRTEISKETIGSNTFIEVYHQSYEPAKRILEIKHTATLGEGMNPSDWTINPSLAATGSTVIVTYTGAGSAASVTAINNIDDTQTVSLTPTSTANQFSFIMPDCNVHLTATLAAPVTGGNCGKQGDNLQWQYYDNNSLVITGTGEMADYTLSTTDYPWISYQNTITSVIIEEGATTIGTDAFKNLSALSTVALPSTLTTIASSAFSGTSISSVEIPATVETIGENAFSGTPVTSIEIPADVETIGENAFSGCTGLANITMLGETPPALGSGAFTSCPAGLTITVPSCDALTAYCAATEWSALASKIVSAVLPCPVTISDEQTREQIAATLTALRDNGYTNDGISIVRPVYRNNYFNTLCFPFSMTRDQIDASPLSEATIKEFTGATVENNELQIVLTEVAEIVAGEPYFISYENADALTQMDFENVDVTTITAGQSETYNGVTFKGTFVPFAMPAQTEDSYSYLFLGQNNTLFWPNVANSLLPFRCYFEINTGSNAPVRRGMAARIVEEQQIATGVENVERGETSVQKVLRNGQLYIIRDGVEYNAQGMLVR